VAEGVRHPRPGTSDKTVPIIGIYVVVALLAPGSGGWPSETSGSAWPP
jgi:hypothetical protein